MDKVIGFVITAGHLDIEWYQPMRSYRFWTLETMEDLKLAAERPDFGLYVLDGQVFPLEEYLSVVPEDENAMKELIKNRKLAIGPFYTQFDEWIPSAENIIRNCLFGNRRAKKFGEVMKAGYLPDNFGHPLQLPQILQNFGIDSLMFMRGMPEMGEKEPDEFWYQGLDGTKILASHFRESYSGAFDIFDKKIDPDQPREVPYYADYLSFEYHKELAVHDDPVRIAKNMIANVHKILPRYPSKVIPLIAGFDHLPPQMAVGESLRAANEMQDEITFIMGDAEEYVQMVKERRPSLPFFKEELLGSRYQYILLGALSTRTYLKRQNFACETLLEHYSEPLLALASLYGYKEHPRLLEEAWENMLLNSAHDSIHGSSVDEVHTEMETRFASVRQIASGLIHESLAYLGKHIERQKTEQEQNIHEVIAYAPQEASGGQPMEVWVASDARQLVAVDETGRKLPSQMIPRPELEYNGIGEPCFEYCPDKAFQKIAFFDTVRQGTVKKYTIVEDKSSGVKDTAIAGQPARIQADDTAMENEWIRVEVENGLLHLLDKRSGKCYHQLNLLKEEADAGDAWDYSPTWTPGEVVHSSAFSFSSRCVACGEVYATLCVTGEMSVPAALHGDRRSAERVSLPIVFEITLWRDTPRVDVKLKLINHAKDHRIRLCVPMGTMAKNVLSQGHLAILSRPVKRPEEKEEWLQPPSQLLPFQQWAAVDDGKCGLAIAAKGLYDYEAENDTVLRQTWLSFTLLRGIGKMGRVHMAQRDGAASGAYATPGAQCLGEQIIEWSYVPYLCEEGEKAPFAEVVQSYLYPPVAHVLRSKPADDTVSRIEAPVVWDTKKLQFSAFKIAQDRDGYILRLYENQGRKVKTKIQLHMFKEAWLSNMNEDQLEALKIEGCAVAVEVLPYQAITIKLKA